MGDIDQLSARPVNRLRHALASAAPSYADRLSRHGSVDCALDLDRLVAGFSDEAIPRGELPPIASSELIQQFGAVMVPALPSALDRLFESVRLNELAIGVEIAALKRANETLRGQLSHMSLELSRAVADLKAMRGVIQSQLPSAAELLYQSSAPLVDAAEEARLLAAIGEKRSRYSQGLTGQQLEEQIRNLVEAEFSDPDSGLEE